mgnify:CR=1 FL=1
MAKVEADLWYLKVECRNPKCRRGIALGGPFQSPLGPQGLPPTIEAVCPHCGQTDQWTPEDVRFAQGRRLN